MYLVGWSVSHDVAINENYTRVVVVETREEAEKIYNDWKEEVQDIYAHFSKEVYEEFDEEIDCYKYVVDSEGYYDVIVMQSIKFGEVVNIEG